MINAEALSKCKKGVAILNVARGGIIDESALLDAINAGTVKGAALDVFETEPPVGVGAELAKHKNVIATPHLGASTLEAHLGHEASRLAFSCLERQSKLTTTMVCLD